MSNNKINTITTADGANIRVTAKTKEIADSVQVAIAEQTGVNKPLGAIVGELIYEKAKELGVDGGNFKNTSADP